MSDIDSEEQLKIDLGFAIAHGTYLDEEAREASFEKLWQAIQDWANRKANMGETNFIALACPQKDCNVAQVSPRSLSRVGDTICDPPSATSVWQLCPQHYEEGDIPEYFDKNGKQVSGDPETFKTPNQRKDS